ncbi:MAG TPA: YihY family inner membrane protein [Burkholderiaceae bacterium]|nr:YihY family inner membrane protein [Burkholderiaceae bacterium]
MTAQPWPHRTATLAGYRHFWLSLWQTLLAFPWRSTVHTLRERFREDRLGPTAGSLAFTTIISLVPLMTVGLAVFSAFPMFGQMEAGLQKWLVSSLVPDNIAKPVLLYLKQFAGKAGKIGWTGAVVLLLTALALVLTIDRKLNDIWRVRRPRPLAQRVLVYWAALTLGPLLLGGSLTLASYALSASKGLVDALPGGMRLVFDVLEFGLVALGLTMLYRYVPNTRVEWAHAWAGALFAAVGVELAKKLLAWYVATVPTYSMVYGTFATVPILLVWLYVLWVLVLLGAVITAYLPSLLAGVVRRGGSPGWSFQLALEVVALLAALRTRSQSGGSEHGLGLSELASQLKVDDLQLEEPLETLVALDWVGKLDEEQARYVLLADPACTQLGPLADKLLLPRKPHTGAVWRLAGFESARLADALPPSAPAD